jgi:tripartite-type tricarboxylate transporter receptor subunit TctC
MDVIDAWYGVLAPARTPPELVQRLNRDFAEVMSSPDVRAELERQGLQARTGAPAQLGELMRSDLARWRKLVDRAGIKAD